MISSSPEVSSTAQLAQVRTETLYGVKRRMNLRLPKHNKKFNMKNRCNSEKSSPPS